MSLDLSPSAPALGPGDAVVFSDRALYETYNFHDPEAVERLAGWLARDGDEDVPGVAVVAGRPGSGRDYLVRAAAWRAGERGAPVRHARLSFDGFDPDHHASMTAFADHQLRMHFAPTGDDLPASARDRRGALLDLAASLPASFLGAAGIAFLVKAAVSLVDLQSLLRPGAPALAGPAAPAEEHLRAILDFATRAARLVLVLPADELPEPVVQWFVHEPRRNRRLSVVLAMAAAPAADALYGEPMAHMVQPGQMTPESLRERVGLRFGPNEFPDRFFSGLWKRTQGVAGQVALAMMDLDRMELVTRGSGPGRPWRLAVEPDDERLVEYFASHFYDQLNQLRNQHGPMDLHVVRFVELAALCGSIIPARLIASYMGLADHQRDELLDRVDGMEDAGRPVFICLDYQHPTFRNERSEPELVYRFADESNRLIVLRRMVQKSREAKGVLNYLSDRIPVITRGTAELLAAVSAQLDWNSEDRQDCERRLRWWIAAEEADTLTEMMIAQVASGELDPMLIWDMALKSTRCSALRRLAFLNAMEAAEGGIPLDLVPSFHYVRSEVLVDLGLFSKALKDCRAALDLIGPEDLSMLRQLHLRAGFCCQMITDSDPESALWHASEAYRVTLSVYGAHTGAAGEAASRVADALFELDRPSEAEAYLDHALRIAAGVSDDELVGASFLMNALGLLLTRLGRDEEAATCHRKALESQARIDAVQGGPGTNYLMGLFTLGHSLRRSGQLQESYSHFTNALDLATSISTQNHPAYSGSLCELLVVDIQAENWEAAIDWAQRLDALLANGNPEAVGRVRSFARKYLGPDQFDTPAGALPASVRHVIHALLASPDDMIDEGMTG